MPADWHSRGETNVKEIIPGTHICRAFCAVFGESDGEAWRLLSQDARKWKEKGQNQVKLREVLMQPGEKLNLTRSIRSAKTGSLLPKEGTLVSVTENLGRTLLLVEFARGHREYVFENEVEFEQDHSSSSNRECYL
jgi:hypothetical protein